MLKKNKLIKYFAVLLLIVSGMLILNSCYPGDELTAADTDVIATFFDPEVNFANKLTYAMPDSIARFDEEGNLVYEVGAYDQQILSKIEAELQEMGFTEVSDPATADVVVVSSVSKQTTVSGGCYSWWYSWYYPYYGWCYPVYYTYQTGTLLIVMVDPDYTESRTAMWVAAINGILEDTSAGILTRVQNSIDRAFLQSPYLGEGK
jgi:hypothetical protein